MAIKVSGTTVIDNSRNITNIESATIDSIAQPHNTVNSASGTVTLDVGANSMHTVNMVDNITIAFSNAAAGQTGVIVLNQDSTGGRTFSLGSAFKTPNGGASIAQSTGGSTRSVLSYTVIDSSNILVNYIGNFA